MGLPDNVITTFAFTNAMKSITPGPTDLGDLFDKQLIENFDSSEAIFFEGDPARHVFEIIEGVVRLCRILADGRRVITGFLFAGDIIGLSQERLFAYSAEAVTPVKIRRITRKALDAAVGSSAELRSQMLARLCGEVAAAQEQMVLLSCKSAEERVCSFLVMLLKRQRAVSPAAAVVALPMSRLDMAEYLGITIETVSRNLTKLAIKGVIGQVERFHVQVMKSEALEELAGVWDDGDDFPRQTSRCAAGMHFRH